MTPNEADLRPTQPPILHATLAELVARAQALQVPGERGILGITGAPGAGKSTLCAALLEQLGQAAAVVPMDGFHLANQELARLGRRERKGAPDTFDAEGYAALLERLRQPKGHTIYAPVFDRSLEESIGSALPVLAETPLIVTEGNYLLLNEGGWPRVRAAIDAVWYLEVPDNLRLERLVRRHEVFGRSPEEAGRWVEQVDQRNAEVIGDTRDRADLIIQLVAEV
ncbi:nucleoside/nucleotide kinase family protein [Deinococcus sp. Arct2-2]|uniref:nucleoside/nucleotide kinase family protein n=1 Tax=Deinococcus sp. Arct2-2 TaxID=2568653 RepID=UPI0010A503E9|nr:nucleoside/nucleotide kinase family protein [Deinococcus sp. Arct2-2]THF69727.1 nucleoside/nucleotide kinase family protein [Deinococcus sp. Arct2-2]